MAVVTDATEEYNLVGSCTEAAIEQYDETSINPSDNTIGYYNTLVRIR